MTAIKECYREYVGRRRSVTKDFEKGLLFVGIKYLKRVV
jgi:hypothetical protein